MTVGARIAWIVVVLALVAGGAVGLFMYPDWSEASDRFERVSAERASLGQEKEDLRARWQELRDERFAEHAGREECYLEIHRVRRTWNQLFDDATFAPNAPRSDAYAERASDIVDEAREVASICSEL